MKAYMYKEGNKYWVVYGNFDSFFGPSERSFDTKKAAEIFMNEQNNK